MKKRIFYTILVLLVTIGGAFAQNVAEDLNKVRASFLNAKQIGFEVEVYHFKTKGAKGELLSKGIMRKSGKNYYSSFMGSKMIVNKNKGTIIVDEDSKRVTYFNAQKKVQKPAQLALPDSVFNRFKFKGKTGEIKKYEYKSTNLKADIIRTVIHINAKHQLTKIIYYYNKDTEKVSYDAYKIEINYKNVITSNINNNYFNINKYIVLKNNKPQLTKQYAHYKLLD